MKFSSTVLTTVLATLAAASPIKRDTSIPDWAQGFLGTTYTGYNKDYQCRSADQIKADISALSGHFSVLRLYDNACNEVQYAAEAFDGQIMVAVNDISSNDAIIGDLNNLATSVGLGGKQFNDFVHSVFVGNELIYNGWYSADEVSNFISQAKAYYPDFPGKWTTGETASSYYSNPSLCGAVDYVAINNHPYFDSQSPEDAGSYVLGHIQAVAEFCEQHGYYKSVMTSETGWPSSGSTLNGVSVPSEENQKIAVGKIKDAAANDCILFSAYNELWKSDEFDGEERAWGVLGDSPNAA